MRAIGIFLALILLGAASPSAAQSPDLCKDVLIQNVDFGASDTELRLSSLKIIDRGNFESAKKSYSSGGSALVNGVLLSGYANYDDFNEARSREFQKYEFRYSLDQAINYTRSWLPASGSSAFVECLRTLTNATGVYLWLDRVSDARDRAFVTLFWNAPKTEPGSHLITLEANGGSLTAQSADKIQEMLTGSREIPLTFVLEPGEEFVVQAQVAGYAAKPPVIIPLPPSICEECAKPPLNISGVWTLVANNYTFTVTAVQKSDGKLTGTMITPGVVDSTIEGSVTGDSVKFARFNPELNPPQYFYGVIGVTSDGLKMWGIFKHQGAKDSAWSATSLIQ